jgi:predicted AAA+ superfamily ATPase
VNLLEEARFQEYLARPGTFADELRLVAPDRWVVLDEVQRLPNLLNEVHRFIEERRMRFVLAGSSARKLHRQGVNLLAGRAVRRHLYPFVPEELGGAFRLEDALRYGTLPIVHQAEDRRATLEAYAQLYLKEEVQAEALVRNLAGFARFLPIAALFHGQALNVASLARDAGVARTTVNGYVDILEETLVAYRVPAYEARLRVRERKHPKLYWIDPGLVRALKRHWGPVGSEERNALLEGFVAMLLRAYSEYRDLSEGLSYWAPSEAAETEVDFVLRRGGERLAVEVKSSRTVSAPLLRGLRAIADLPGLRRRVLVYLGPRDLRTDDGIDVLTVGTLLEELARGTLWERA